MTALYWILTIFLTIVFIVCVIGSCNPNFDSGDRMAELFIAFVAFGIMLVLKKCWR